MTKKTTKTKSEAKSLHNDEKLPFLEHFKELKRRLTIVAVSVGVFGAGAYFIQHKIVGLLLKPASGQHLIYTTPGGGLDFLFRVCVYTGIVFSLPVIIYQILKYFEPLLGGKSLRFALLGSSISAVLAIAGMAFGYYAGLPATLHFLFHQFNTSSEIQPLIAVQSYMGFVTLYMFGAALLFQIPLILLFINRIKPLKPRSLLKAERWFILGSFILSVLMNPTPNVIDQVMLAGPMIAMYQVGILLIWLANKGSSRHTALVESPQSASEAATPQGSLSVQPSKLHGGKRNKLNELFEQDALARAERAAKLADAKLIWEEATAIAEHPVSSIVAIADHEMPKIVAAELTARPATIQVAAPEPRSSSTRRMAPVAVPVTAGRPRHYVDGFSRNRNQITPRRT